MKVLAELNPGLTLAEAIDQVADSLDNAKLAFGHGTEDAEEEASWLVLAASEEQMGQPDYDWERLLGVDEISAINELLKKRVSSGQPLAYLLGEAWFAGLRFKVDPRVLVPRSFMVEWIDEQFAPWVNPDEVDSILDLCCGSGCIGIAAALALEAKQLVLSDLSAGALEVAAINSAEYLADDNVQLHQGDMFSGIHRKFDLILCNPPYVSTERMDTLPAEYVSEPDMALRAGDRGLDFIAPMLQQVRHYLTDRGVLIVEAGSASLEMERAWPDVPFTWLGTAHDEMVLFVMTAAELDQYKQQLDSFSV